MDTTAGSVLLVGSGVYGFLVCGGSLFVARWVGLARPASARLRAVVDLAAARVGVSPRQTYEIPSRDANAYAFPITRRLAFTKPILVALNDDELVAVTAHEFGHLTESAGTLVVRSLPAFVVLPLAVARPAIAAFGEVPYLVGILVFFILVRWVRGKLQQLEVRADLVGAAHEGEAGTYARALEKIYEENLAPTVMPGKRQSHPHLYDRLLAAGMEPAYPRPAPPSQWRIALAFGMSLTIVLTSFAGVRFAGAAVLAFVPGKEQALVWCIGMYGGTAWELSRLARLRDQQGKATDAVTLYRAACEVDWESPSYPANLAIVLAHLNRCAEAEQALEEAETRFQLGEPTASKEERISLAKQAIRVSRMRLGQTEPEPVLPMEEREDEK
jgi:Zn-dependent protease with chaperone function